MNVYLFDFPSEIRIGPQCDSSDNEQGNQCSMFIVSKLAP